MIWFLFVSGSTLSGQPFTHVMNKEPLELDACYAMAEQTKNAFALADLNVPVANCEDNHTLNRR